MAFKVKSFFKGLFRMFDQKEEEEEMQIGAPTDVKHVAHIGSDGPSATTPSWMNDFKSAAESTGEGNAEGSTSSKPRHKTRDSEGSSPTKKSKHRRHKSKDTEESPSTDPSRRTRRHHRSSKPEGQSAGPTDIPDVPKDSRRKKSKDSAGGRSETTTKSNYNGDSMTDLSFTSLASADSESVTGA